MEPVIQPENQAPGFIDRRRSASTAPGGIERRQFQDSRAAGRPEVNEFASAVDEYKLNNRRRFITYEELYDIFMKLGYSRG